jgi:hypothetical protein
MLLGQRFSYGLTAGSALTDDFNSSYYPSSGGFLPTNITSGDKSVIVGPTLEWNFTPRFSVEADGLFRELRYKNSLAGDHNPTVTWEFPILAKYRLFSYSGPRSSVRPFLEAGPAFRTTGNLNAYPSHTGISAGGGLDFRLRKFDISPTLRYTRWAEDGSTGYRSRADQIEFLVGFTRHSSLDSLPFGNRLSFGVLLGVNLFGDYHSASDTGREIITDYLGATTENPVTYSTRSGPRSLLIGPSVEFRLIGDLSLEADAIYRPIRAYYNTVSPQFSSSGDSSEVTWQFPILAKYKLPWLNLGNRLRTFVEAGPSFRIPQTVTNFGFAAGGGVSIAVGPIKIAPTLRYTKWQTDLTHARTNEADLLVGVTF